jgi:ketosteroid isomerase-like protein
MVAEEERTETVRRAHQLFGHADLEGVMELCSPDVTFTTFLGQMEGRAYHGRDGVREWLRNLHQTFSEFSTECVAAEPAGDGVIAEVVMRGTANGLELEDRLFQAVVFDDGLASWWGWYRSREEALEAVGGAR